MDPSTNPSTPEETQLSAAVPEPLRASAPPNIAATVQLLEHGRREIGKVIAGQTELIDQALITVLCHGHALVEGVPGIAKTLLVKLLGAPAGAELPARAGHSGPDAGRYPRHHHPPGRRRDSSSFTPGPVFTDLLLVDEINRMPPRTQAALLECMEERQVTSDDGAPPVAGGIHGLRYAEPDRLRGNVSAAGSATRSLSDEDPGGLPDGRTRSV